MSFPRNPSSFGENQYGAAGAAEIQNSFVDFEFVTLPGPTASPVKLSRAYGPNFAYTNGAVPILVAFGDSSARRLLFIPGETINGLRFQNAYVWAAETSQAGNIALVKWGAQDMRPSIRQLPGNPLAEITTIAHYPLVGEYGVSDSPEVIAFSANRVSLEIVPKPGQNLVYDGAGLYAFGLGHSAAEANFNYERAMDEVGMIAASTFAFTEFLHNSENRPFGYLIDDGVSRVFLSKNACILGPGPLYFTHNLATTIFANTPYNIIVREKYNTF